MKRNKVLVSGIMLLIMLLSIVVIMVSWKKNKDEAVILFTVILVLSFSTLTGLLLIGKSIIKNVAYAIIMVCFLMYCAAMMNSTSDISGIAKIKNIYTQNDKYYLLFENDDRCFEVNQDIWKNVYIGKEYSFEARYVDVFNYGVVYEMFPI
ncbi:MAG: hypothetical protein IKQ22_00035 [Clostridia bacterium]|nr:hypothetical protein [Clostridia bacterium]